MKINVLKVKVLDSEIRTSQTGRLYRSFKLLVETPFWDKNKGLIAAQTIIFAASGPELELSTENTQFVFVSTSKSNGIWINSLAA